MVGIQFIDPVYWFSKQSTTKNFKSISTDHYLHSCYAMQKQDSCLIHVPVVCIGEHS